MSFNKHDLSRNAFMLDGSFAFRGYDWWWHSFTGISEKSGKERQFFIEYYLCNPALAKDEPVFGQLPENRKRGIRPSYLMVNAGSWGEGKCQLHRFFPWREVSIKKDFPFELSADDCFASDKAIRGSIIVSHDTAKAHPEYMSDSGDMSWDLALDKITAFNVGYGAGKLFRMIKAFEMYWHAEGMKTAYSGYVIFRGERYRVDPQTSYGYADKNWGRDFTSPWVWLSSCSLMSTRTGRKLENSAFDIGGGRPAVYCFPLDRKLLSAVWYEGKPYEFNFSKFWTLPGTKFRAKETEDEVFWYVVQKNRKAMMSARVRCKKSDMLLINYESPDGRKRHNRLFNGGNGTGLLRLYERNGFGKTKLIDEIKADRIGCEYGEYCPKTREEKLVMITLYDANCSPVFDGTVSFFTDDLEDFERRWQKLDGGNDPEQYARYLRSKAGEKVTDYYSDAEELNIVQYSQAKVYASREFVLSDVYVSVHNAYNWPSDMHINRMKVRFRWISFKGRFYRIAKFAAYGICVKNVFAEDRYDSVTCYGNPVLENIVDYKPQYRYDIPRSRWEEPSFADFDGNSVKSICYLTNRCFADEKELVADMSDFVVSDDVLDVLLSDIVGEAG